MKKAAMFGLDARIALAIFGALSIIAGVTYSKIVTRAKAMQIVGLMDSIAKAYDQYYLDTGSQIPKYYMPERMLRGIELLENKSGVSGWKGPYLQLKSKGDVSFKCPEFLPGSGCSIRMVAKSEKSSISCDEISNHCKVLIYVETLGDKDPPLSQGVVNALVDIINGGTTNKLENKFYYVFSEVEKGHRYLLTFKFIEATR